MMAIMGLELNLESSPARGLGLSFKIKADGAGVRTALEWSLKRPAPGGGLEG